MSEVPAQGISYDPKMDSLIAEVNQPEGSPEFSLWHPEELIEGTEYLSDLKETYESREKLKVSADEVRDRFGCKARQGMDQILDWIEEELGERREKIRR